MKKNIKFVISFLFVIGAFAVPMFAQQVTRFGVVDTFKVYNAYFRDSAPVRNYESKKKEYEAEINKRVEEIRELNNLKTKYKSEGKESEALKISEKIIQKSQYLTELTNVINADLLSRQELLMTSDEFYKKLASTLAKIAESGGYSMILSLQDANAILWYSKSVDITEDVIKALGL